MAKKRAKRQKRANGEGSITDLGDNRFRVEVTIAPGPDGKRRRKSRTIRGSRADAAIALRELHNEIATGTPDLPDMITVGEWLRQRHELYEQAGWAEGSIDDRSRCVVLHLVPHLGDVKLSTLTAGHIEALLRTWAKDEVGMRTREKAFRVLRSAVEIARSRGLIACDPFYGVDRPKSRRTNVDPFTEAEMKLILAAAKGATLEALWVLAFGCGMRLGEMLALSPRCVDLAAGTLRVERTGRWKGRAVKLRVPKTARSRRTIELPKRVTEALIAHRAKVMARGHAGSDFFFPDRSGQMLRAESVRRNSWHAILKKAELAQKPIHQTRHTYATLALIAGVPVHVVSAVLGHASPSITLDIYSHFVPRHQSLAREAMDRIMPAGG